MLVNIKTKILIILIILFISFGLQCFLTLEKQKVLALNLSKIIDFLLKYNILRTIKVLTVNNYFKED